MASISYYRRVFSAYVLRRRSQLTFWHETPGANPSAAYDRPGPYYMTFSEKADYPGPFDSAGVPLLDYRGKIGRQYNPIAIAQYGLARYNRFMATGSIADRSAFLAQADWLVSNLGPNRHGVPVWNHRFDWEYVQTLKAPWYSGLAQGQGLSALVRAHAATDDSRYLDCARSAFRSLTVATEKGGALWAGPDGSTWIEEYIVNPPSHILNGSLWALWGVRDFAMATGDAEAESLFDRCAETLAKNLAVYDAGFWSLYDLTRPGRMKMLASPFYHRLHIVQLRVTSRMTGRRVFADFADRWESYAASWISRRRSLAYKAVFKLLHY
jgi:hypothetical protein